MRMCIRGQQTMVTETSKTINFWGRFVYNMVTYWMAILFIGITFLNQARAWFLRIASVRELQYVCVCVCVCPRGYQ